MANKWFGTGRLTREPEIHGEGDNRVAIFTFAVSRDFKNKDGEYDADFMPCVAFGKKAAYVERTCKQGTVVAVVGRIRTGSYTNKDGQKVYTTDVHADSVDPLANRKDSPATTNTAPDVDEELPFN